MATSIDCPKADRIGPRPEVLKKCFQLQRISFTTWFHFFQNLILFACGFLYAIDRSLVAFKFPVSDFSYYLSSGESGAAEREIFKVWVRSVGAGRVVTGGEGCWLGRSQQHLLFAVVAVAVPRPTVC